MLQGDDNARYRVANILWETQPELRGWEWGHLMAQCPLEEWSLQTDRSGLQTIAATADGRSLVTAGTDGMVSLWDVDARRQVWRSQDRPGVQTRRRSDESFCRRQHRRQCALRQFRILDLANGHVAHESEQSGQADLAFGASGKEIYVFDYRGTLRRIATSTWEQCADGRRRAVRRPRPRSLARGQADRPEHPLRGRGRKLRRHFLRVQPVCESRVQYFDAMTLGPSNRLDRIQEPAVNVSSPRPLSSIRRWARWFSHSRVWSTGRRSRVIRVFFAITPIT